TLFRSSGRGAGCNVADTPYGVVAHGIHRKDVNIAAGDRTNRLYDRGKLGRTTPDNINNDRAVGTIGIEGDAPANQGRDRPLRLLQLPHVDRVVALRAVGQVGNATLEGLAGIGTAHGDGTAWCGVTGQIAASGHVGFIGDR